MNGGFCGERRKRFVDAAFERNNSIGLEIIESLGLRVDHLPTYLVIGHVARDKTPKGAVLGGTCSYAGLTAHKLGHRVAAVTSYGPDIPSLIALDGIQIENVAHPFSTTFENIYRKGTRQQKWSATAAALSYDNVPAAWRKTPIVHLAPIAQEMSPAICAHFQESLLCATLQGWLRGWNGFLNVTYSRHPELTDWFSRIDVLVFSESDLFDDRAVLIPLLTRAKLAVETLGERGCRVYHNGRVTDVPVKVEKEVDPTGAGDIFAAAFFARYRERGDFINAARFANACAALSVRKTGLESVPSLPEVEAHVCEIYDG